MPSGFVIGARARPRVGRRVQRGLGTVAVVDAASDAGRSPASHAGGPAGGGRFTRKQKHRPGWAVRVRARRRDGVGRCDPRGRLEPEGR
jgi:hypothetical protein